MTQQGSAAQLKLKNGILDSINFAKLAETIMKKNEDWKFGGLTVSKLRGIYGLIMNVYTKTDISNFESHKSDIQYLKVKMAYEAGREKSVMSFLEESSLMKAIDSIETYDDFLLYCRYAESLVAYFKFYGGKEK